MTEDLWQIKFTSARCECVLRAVRNCVRYDRRQPALAESNDISRVDSEMASRYTLPYKVLIHANDRFAVGGNLYGEVDCGPGSFVAWRADPFVNDALKSCFAACAGWGLGLGRFYAPCRSS